MSGGGLTRTMVIWMPDWPVTAAAVATGRSPDEPIAVLEKGKVLATSAAARAEGVRRGQRARDAQSRCPELVVLKYDPVIDARAFDPVIACLEALTPGVQVIRPGMCALKARGPARFYGSESVAAEKLLDRLETFDVFGGRVGIADGPFAAEQAARASSVRARVLVVPPGESPEFLAPLTVDVLEQPTLTDLLRRLGLRSLGVFARLPGSARPAPSPTGWPVGATIVRWWAGRSRRSSPAPSTSSRPWTGSTRSRSRSGRSPTN